MLVKASQDLEFRELMHQVILATIGAQREGQGRSHGNGFLSALRIHSQLTLLMQSLAVHMQLKIFALRSLMRANQHLNITTLLSVL